MKNRDAATKAYMDAVAGLGCLACRKDGIYGTPAVLHHSRAKAGMAERGDDMEVIGLCPAHHVGQGMPLKFVSIHGRPKEFHAKYGSDADLSELARVLLGHR